MTGTDDLSATPGVVPRRFREVMASVCAPVTIVTTASPDGPHGATASSFITAARLVRGGRRKTLKIAASWPWATAITMAWKRIQALPHPT
jgi:hypothetical protein